MRIESVKNQPDRAGRFSVQLEDGTVMRLYKQTIQDFGIYPGAELSDADLKRLQDAAEKMSAKMRAVRIVSASSVSKKDLEQRLVYKGESPENARQAVAWMCQLDLLDDLETARQVVNRCISKGYGLSRAKQALYEKKIPKEYWQEVLTDYPDQQDSIVQFLANRLEDDRDPKQVRRAIDALLRRGHTYSQIHRALEMLAVDDQFPEE